MISIIVPVYNTAAYLDQCLSSLVNQSCSDLEIILIDDCSTDGSRQIVDHWANTDQRIRAIHSPENRGVCCARNTGMAMAKGEYLTFVDSDDFVAPSFYERLLELLEKYGADIAVSSWYNYVGEKAEKARFLSEGELVCGGLEALDVCLPRFGERDLNMVLWNKLFRRDALLDSEGNFHLFDPALNYCEDVLWIASFFQRAKTVVLCDEAYYYYRRERLGSASIALRQSTRHTVSAISVYLEIHQMLRARRCQSAANSLQRSLHHRLVGMRASLQCRDRGVFRFCAKGFFRALFSWVRLERNAYALRWALKKTAQYILIRTGLTRFHAR